MKHHSVSLKFQLLAVFILAVVFLISFLKKAPTERVAAVPVMNQACLQAYQKLYARDTVEIVIVFGYKDSRPARFVGDRYERAHLVSRLLDLSFTRDPLDDDLFATRVLGPEQKLKNVKVRLVHSSVGPDDDANRLDPYQRYQSAEAQRVFLEGLASADAVFYNGHSRDGGGPDFEPPLCNPTNHHVSYAWYQKHQPGLKKMITALKEAKKKPEMLGLFSCSSGGHFSNAIRSVNENALITTSSLLYYSDALEGLVDTLDGLLKLKCQADFHPLGTHLIGFFPDSHSKNH